ncbi:putative class III chitinase [Pseudomassariella vexata]|uniref:chitinase n=1 Tax=Pseudomassariella vexata TaxID=1141098 RepID=A0A1Y2DPB6_9PEZI|nr:putative class III chitinase [Pseudomassariella vexata]ORY61019.1 putative class III chitinase [Pseudomassariella vexata]
MAFSKILYASATIISALPAALAGFNVASQSNIAVYWGQNSYGQASSQQRLSTYCSNGQVDIIPLAFLNGVNNPITNFANAGDNCTVFTGTQLLNCPQIEEDIKTCQATYGKTILVSIGGATYTEGGFTDAASAQAAATNIWNLFGPNTAYANRPFRTAVIDGFDFDFESITQNMVPFAQKLRDLMNASTSKTYYLSAAPQCPYPDLANNDMLNGAISFDFIMVQFYNNYCGVQAFVPGAGTQNNFNFQTWDTWAKQTSKNENVKVLLGIPANTGAGAGYQTASALALIIAYCKQFSSFGGIMIWDMSQLWANSGFLDAVYASLISGGSPITANYGTTLVAGTTKGATVRT